MTPASRSRPVRRSSGSVTPSNSGYNPRTWLKRAAFTSHTAFRVQLGSPLKLRTRSGPQYPQPITPTEIGCFIFSSRHHSYFSVSWLFELLSPALLSRELATLQAFAHSTHAS